MFEKNKDYPLSRYECLNMQKHFWFVAKFEHVNFAINGNYFEFFNENPNYYVSLVIFQTYKTLVLKSVHPLGGSFDWVFIHMAFLYWSIS